MLLLIITGKYNSVIHFSYNILSLLIEFLGSKSKLLLNNLQCLMRIEHRVFSARTYISFCNFTRFLLYGTLMTIIAIFYVGQLTPRDNPA